MQVSHRSSVVQTVRKANMGDLEGLLKEISYGVPVVICMWGLRESNGADGQPVYVKVGHAVIAYSAEEIDTMDYDIKEKELQGKEIKDGELKDRELKKKEGKATKLYVYDPNYPKSPQEIEVTMTSQEDGIYKPAGWAYSPGKGSYEWGSDYDG